MYPLLPAFNYSDDAGFSGPLGPEYIHIGLNLPPLSLPWAVKVKVKVKVHPITGHEDSEGE